MAEFVKPKISKSSATQNCKKEGQERKRVILHLILSYLEEINLLNSATALQNEAQISDQYKVCDNIDLDIILQEFQSYYYTKFQREPKIIRKVSETRIAPIRKDQSAKLKARKKIEKTENYSSPQESEDFQFEIISFNQNETINKHSDEVTYQNCELNMKKPLCDFKGYSAEWRELADQIMKELVPKNLNVKWTDCIGLDDSIELLKEATIYPLEYPDLFRGLSSTWKGILLYGTPGTGKTLLAKALACEGNMTFINVISSTFISKWRGDSEKMVKVLFDVAKYYAPSTIFIDEIDSLISDYKEIQHEASSRFKSELLIQIDGILTSNELVFILATTNSPWKLNKALLRRFEKRILIPLPTDDVKINIFQHHMKCDISVISKNDMKNLISATKNFSGAEMQTVCKEVEMTLIREQLKMVKQKKKQSSSIRSVSQEDILKAINSVKPCVNLEEYKKFLDWNSEFGSKELHT